MNVNEQITDTFIAYDGNWNRITGLNYQKFVWVNGISSNTIVNITEDTITGGAYYLQFTPITAGEWYVHLFNLSASFDAYYFVDNGNTNNIAAAVWGFPTSGLSISAGSMGEALSATYQVQTGRWRMFNNQLVLYDADGITTLQAFNLFDTGGNPSLTGVVQRIPI
jgi:hypothetical protein